MLKAFLLRHERIRLPSAALLSGFVLGDGGGGRWEGGRQGASAESQEKHTKGVRIGKGDKNHYTEIILCK